MAAKRCPTGKVLERFWQRWAALYEHQNGSTTSKRAVSESYFEGKPDLLARWTTAADRSHWRFPLARLDELVAVFELKPDDIDDIMVARIEELEQDPETLRLLTWLADFLDRGSLDEDERLLISTWRRVRPSHALGLSHDAQGRADAEKVLTGLLRAHSRRQTEEHDADMAEDRAYVEEVGGAEAVKAERAGMLERARAVGAEHLKRQSGKRPKPISAKQETRALLTKIREMARSSGR